MAQWSRKIHCIAVRWYGANESMARWRFGWEYGAMEPRRAVGSNRAANFAHANPRPTAMRGERTKREMLQWEGRDSGGMVYDEQHIFEKGHQ